MERKQRYDRPLVISIGVGISVGSGMGTALGVAMHNIGLGSCVRRKRSSLVVSKGELKYFYFSTCGKLSGY